MFGNAGNDRRRAGTGAAAHAGGDEHHVGAFQLFFDFFRSFFRRFAADFGTGAGTEPAGGFHAELDFAAGF